MRYRSSLLAIAVLTLGLTLGACKKAEEAPPVEAPPAEAPAAPAPEAAAPAPADSTVATTGFGVAECDDYWTKMTACVDANVPAEGRAAFHQSMEATKTAWNQAASTPEGKAALATSCKQALDAAKTSMAAYNCTW